jgi:hypothetical protein
VSLRLQCCVCGGYYPEALIGWWYEQTAKALRLGADGDGVALAVVAAPELKRGHLCSRRCAYAFEVLTGGKVEPSPWLQRRKAAELGKVAA